MMLKEVMLLESVENAGPEGLWVKVERVGMSGCRGTGVGSGWAALCPLVLVLSPSAAVWVLPEGAGPGVWLCPEGHSDPAMGGHGARADPVPQ